MPRIYRIAAESARYRADDLSGAGAKATGGRWNSEGVAVMYFASTVALACLETLVHFNSAALPIKRFLVAVDLSDEQWADRVIVTDPPTGWDELPPGAASAEVGDRWVADGRHLLMDVPSIVVPEERNILINPAHPEAGGLTALKLRRWTYDQRLIKP